LPFVHTSSVPVIIAIEIGSECVKACLERLLIVLVIVVETSVRLVACGGGAAVLIKRGVVVVVVASSPALRIIKLREAPSTLPFTVISVVVRTILVRSLTI